MNEDAGEFRKEVSADPRLKQKVMTPEEVYDQLLRLGFSEEDARRVKLAVRGMDDGGSRP